MTGRSAAAARPAIVVLGAKLAEDGGPGPALLRRVAHAARLCAAGAADVVLASGGPAGAAPTEARVMRDALVAAGVPAGAILEEDRSGDTLENARFSATILRARGLGPAIVVSDRYHLPRALLLFRLFGVRASGSGPPLGEGYGLARRLVMALRETVSIPRDLARGIAGRMAAAIRGS